MKLLVGPANSGKSERVLSRLAESLASPHARVVLVTPSSNASGVMLFRLQERLREYGVRPARPQQLVKTFPSLYTDILIATGIEGQVIETIERDRLLRRVILDLSREKRLDYFADIAESPGLANALSGLIDELWRSGTDPEAFSQIAQDNSAKDRDISLIFDRYSIALGSAGSIDAEGAGLRAVRALETIASDPGRAASIRRRFSLIAADGFNLYTPIQVKLLSLLASLNIEVISTLTWREGRAVHLWQQPTLDRFKKIKPEIIELSERPKGKIGRAASLLMRDSADDSNESSVENDSTYSSSESLDESITVISAPDRAAEARAVAREIKSLIVENGFTADEIAIVCRSVSPYAHHLERVFAESAIPLKIDRPLALSDNPLIYAILKLMALAANGFPRRLVLDLMRSPYFDLKVFGLDEQAINLIDYLSMNSVVLRGRDQWIQVIGSAESDSQTEFIDKDITKEERQEKRRQIAESLNAFFDAITFAMFASTGRYVARVRELIEQLQVADHARQSEWHERDRMALERFFNVIENLRKDAFTNADDRLEFRHFYSEVERGVMSATFERPADYSVSIVVQEVHSLRPRRYRAVFAMGLIEGEFPARITETSPYTLIERDELRRRGIDLTETTGDPGADLLQFYRVMASSTDRLYLSYARTDVAGGELLRSYLIDEVTSVSRCREIRLKQSPAETDHSRIISLEELALVAARDARDAFIEDGPGAFAKIRENYAVSLLQFQLRSWRATMRGVRAEYGRIQRTGKGDFSGLFSDLQLRARLKDDMGANHYWSASQINDYGVCPFRFFAKHLLKLREIKEPSEGFVSTELGTAYHRILERVYTHIRDKVMQITAEDESQCVALVEDTAEAILEEMNEKGETRKGPFWEFEKREIKRHVTRLLLAESVWRQKQPAKPSMMEIEFGLKGTAPLVVESEDGDVRLCGVIDRIDEAEDGLVVVDYKLGRTPLHHKDALDGRNLQLPIYAMAVDRIIRKAPVASAYYLHITSRKKGTELPKGDDANLSVSRMISLAEEYIRDYVSSARHGQFPVRPNGNRCYPRCEYEVMCRIQSLGSSPGDRNSDGRDDE